MFLKTFFSQNRKAFLRTVALFPRVKRTISLKTHFDHFLGDVLRAARVTSLRKKWVRLLP